MIAINNKRRKEPVVQRSFKLNFMSSPKKEKNDDSKEEVVKLKKIAVKNRSKERDSSNPEQVQQ